MAKVTLNNIKKVYGKDIVAVQEFNLEIADKEFIVLVGPSGCGKSTTLRMVAGLEEITSGQLYIGDSLVNDVAPKDRDIAMVFQNYALYPHMTVFENMGFALKLKRVKKEIIEEKVRHAAEILGITELLQRKPKALSGGQRQRVAIGRAIVREPQVFLMDEPLSNLDAKLRNQMRAEIIKLHHRINTTFIYVTHDQTEAMTLGDRIVIMKDGFIQQIGTPREVYNSPENLFVAGFIGTPQMNFFDADLINKNGRYFVRILNTEIEVSDENQETLSAKKQNEGRVILGVRPEHLHLMTGQEENCVNAKVDVIEMMGSEVYLHINVMGKDAVIRVPTIELKDRSVFGEGDEISFVFNKTYMQLFDPQTERSLFC